MPERRWQVRWPSRWESLFPAVQRFQPLWWLTGKALLDRGAALERQQNLKEAPGPRRGPMTEAQWYAGSRVQPAAAAKVLLERRQ